MSRSEGRPRADPQVSPGGRPARGLGLAQVLALGVLQGPTELLPVSSSAHTTLLPWLAGWPYGELEPELRKSFEVALHAGAAAALALDMRGELFAAARGLSARRTTAIALALGPPAIAGYAFERAIERRLGGPRGIAAGLLAGALAMALADARPGLLASGSRPARLRTERREAEVGPLDGLALGLAQVAALAPGVSRNGATLAAARGLGFARADAQALSWHVGLPVIAGASALKAWRLAMAAPHGSYVPKYRTALGAGAACAFLSTLASAQLMRKRMRGRPLRPCALYRCALAATVLVRLRRAQNGGR